ncbi:MAG: hypothetical protein AB2657_20580 [Candidatus Thiodiazotropha endolucinida]
MNITTDTKQTIYLEDIPVGRLVSEGTNQVFYVPSDGRFSQRLLPLNGVRLPSSSHTRTMDAVRAIRKLLEFDG